MNDTTIERIFELRLEYAKNKVAACKDWELAEQSGSFYTPAVRNRAIARTVRSEDITQELERLEDPTLMTVHLSAWENDASGYETEEKVLKALAAEGLDPELVEADSESGGCHIYAPLSYSEALEEIFTALSLDGGVYTADEPYPYGIYNWPSAKRYVDAHVR